MILFIFVELQTFLIPSNRRRLWTNRPVTCARGCWVSCTHRVSSLFRTFETKQDRTVAPRKTRGAALGARCVWKRSRDPSPRRPVASRTRDAAQRLGLGVCFCRFALTALSWQIGDFPSLLLADWKFPNLLLADWGFPQSALGRMGDLTYLGTLIMRA